MGLNLELGRGHHVVVVLKGDEPTARELQPGVPRGRRAPILLVDVLHREGTRDLSGAVGGAVVDEDDFVSIELLRARALERLAEVLLAVVDGNDDRHEWIGHAYAEGVLRVRKSAIVPGIAAVSVPSSRP